MIVSKSYKHTPFQFHSKGIEVSVSHEEIGLSASADVPSFRDNFNTLAREVEALLLIEQVKLGLIHPNQIMEKLKPWLPNTPPGAASPASS